MAASSKEKREKTQPQYWTIDAVSQILSHIFSWGTDDNIIKAG